MSNRDFEAIPEIKDLIERGVVFFNKHKENYDGLRGDYARGAWLAWQARVPEGYVVVPVNTLKRTIGHISTAMCHPMNKKEEEDIMQIDMDIIEKAMLEAVEK